MLLAVSPAAAQGLLPATGADLNIGDLRKQFESAYRGGPAITEPGWMTSAGIDASLAYSDPASAVATGVGKHLGADFYSILSPFLDITGNSSRIEGSLVAAPQFRTYLHDGSLNTFSTDFTGNARATVVPDEIFFDVTGSSTTQSRQGGLATTANVAPNDMVQTTTFSAAPSAQHKFGDIGTVNLSDTLSETLTNAQSGQPTSPFAAPLSTAPSTSNLLHANFTGGDIFGQLATQLDFKDSNSSGGALQGARRIDAAWENDYAMTREWTALTSVGYEHIQYGGLNHYKYAGGTWNLGLRWVPNQDSSISVSYGRHDAGTTATVDADYAPTARLRLSARYSDAITTPQQNLQNALATSSLNAFGQLIDNRTGLPVSTTNSFNAAQSGPVREKLASFTASLLGDRNTYSLSVQQDDTAPLTASSLTPASSGITGSLAFQRELNPSLNGNAYVQLGTRNSHGIQGNTTQDTFGLGAGLQWSISETLSARLQLSYTSSTSTMPGLSQTQTLALIGVHKQF